MPLIDHLRHRLYLPPQCLLLPRIHPGELRVLSKLLIRLRVRLLLPNVIYDSTRFHLGRPPFLGVVLEQAFDLD
jgi:hypothetical protein